MIENGKILQERYSVEKQIGKGGMGAVYLAVDERFGNHVALKETFYNDDEEFGAAFEREAKLLNGLNHSALPHVTDYFTENGENFLVMQYIEGEDLSQILKREKSFPVEQVLQWTDGLLDALDYLHSQNPPVIHRDIKPQNLKITSRGNIFLLDFGLAKLNTEDSTTRSIFGYSRKYSPLEQIQGTGTDARSDIFSLAATVYHLLTGEPPVDALDRAAAIIAGQNDPLKFANEIRNETSVETASFLNKALALNAGERFESAQAMRDILKKLFDFNLSQEVSNQDDLISATEDFNLPNQQFPALATVAATNQTGAPIDDETVNKKSSPFVLERNFSASGADDNLTKVQTKNSTLNQKSRLPFTVAGLILLLVAGLTAGYFINKSISSRAAETPTNANTETSETNSSINSASEQTMILSASGNSIENTEISKETKTDKPAPVKKETVTKNNRSSVEPHRGNGETRKRIVEDEPVYEEIPEEIIDQRQQKKQDRLRRQEQRRRERMEDNNGKRRGQNRRRGGRNDDYFPF